MSRKKLSSSYSIATIGMVLSTIYVVLLLIKLILEVATNSIQQGYFITTLLNYAISIIFYLIVCSYFVRGRTNYAFIYLGICILLISSYIIPAIFQVIENITSLIINWSDPQFYFLSLGMILGIVYFILLVLNTKERRKNYTTALIVFGTIMFVLAILTSISLIITTVEAIKLLFINAGQLGVSGVATMIVYIIEVLLSLTSTAFALIYFLYPINVKRS